VPGQGRLAISSSRVPNLDSFVVAATGDLFSIGTPRHRKDPEITRSQHTNQQKQKGKNLKKNLRARVPGHRALTNVHFEIIYISIFFEHYFSRKATFSSGRSHRGTQTGTWFCGYFSIILIKKLTLASARSASTGNLQIASPKSWWFYHSYRWQFAFHRGSTPPSKHCICEKSVHKSTETRRENLGEKLTRSSARSASTGNLQIASPKSWWCRRHCRWQFAFHPGSTPQKRPWD